MRFPRLLTALGACFLLAACADTTSPQFDGAISAKAEKKPKAEPVVTETFEEPTTTVFTPHFLRYAAAAPALQTYSGQFWAKQGSSTSYKVDYLPDIYGDTEHFLKIDIPSGAILYRPDGSVVAESDSILIGVSIDSELLKVEFEPHGTLFAGEKPVRLRIYYTFADADYNSDGKVDKDDLEIEKKYLGFGYQGTDEDPWLKLSADTRSIKNKYVELTLRHFSNYAVAW